MRIVPVSGRVLAVGLSVALGIGVKSCSQSDHSVEAQNSAPVPAVMDPLTGAPPDGASGQLIRPVLSWKCTDVDGDPLLFDVFLGTNSTPPLVSPDRITSCMVPATLEFNTTYYWRVVAKDDHGHLSQSSTWSFRTRPEALICNASGSPLVGPPPLVVNFLGEGSLGLPPYAFYWLFGDDSTSTSQNPTHLYTDPGDYSAVLKVTDTEYSTCSKLITVTVEGPPACNGLAIPSVGPPPLAVSFLGNATGGKSPYTYFWDFGDGYSSTVKNPSHTFVGPGDYTALFEVTGADGRVCQTPVGITVGPLLACDASGNPVSGPLPLTVRFTGFATGGRGPYLYLWTFGDGVSSSAQNPVHTYNRAGPFTAVLTVGDAGSSTCSKTLRIVAGT